MEIRRANSNDLTTIINLAKGYESKLMPYIYDREMVESYINSFFVAEGNGILGAIHAVEGTYGDMIFLATIKLVPPQFIINFQREGGLFICQLVCPGRGSFGKIIEYLKTLYTPLWCYCSVVEKSYTSYIRHGFIFGVGRRFWNTYKGDYSVFSLGKWERTLLGR